jgi:hypothetical protein
MIPTVHLLVDPRGWPTPAFLDPDAISATVEARLQPGVSVQARRLDDRWFEVLPRGESVLFLFLTQPLAPGWHEELRRWLAFDHTLYALYTDNVNPADIREIAAMTVSQAVPHAPYRIVQQNAAGLDRAAAWIDSMLRKLIGNTPPMNAAATLNMGVHYSPRALNTPEAEPTPPPPIRIQGTRWRNLPSNRQDTYAYPDQLSESTEGAAGYRLVAASFRGKTHAHAGTFREDAVAVTATRYWNIMAVADGAGTAPMARIGSNLAVKSAIEAMSSAMPQLPATEDLGKAIWAGLRNAYQSIKGFAAENNLALSDLHTTLQLLIHWPQERGCLLAVAHVGDGIVTAETIDGQYYLLTDPDTDPDDSNRTLFLTSGPLRQWMERTKVYQFDEPLDIVALMTDGLSGDLEPYADLLHSHLFEALRQRVLCYPLRQREQALLAFIGYDRRGSFDDRTLAVLSRE